MFAVLRVGIPVSEGGAHQDAEGFILIDKTVRMTAFHGFDEILFFCQHVLLPPLITYDNGGMPVIMSHRRGSRLCDCSYRLKRDL